jgi:hypothetical protein
MVPAGDPTNSTVEALAGLLSAGLADDPGLASVRGYAED